MISRVANGRVDMGAYERQTLAASFFIVTTLTDELDYSNGQVSLREAINSSTVSGNSASGAGGGISVFDSLFTNPTMTIDNSIVAGNTDQRQLQHPEFDGPRRRPLSCDSTLAGYRHGTELGEPRVRRLVDDRLLPRAR